MKKDIRSYNDKQQPADTAICNKLYGIINENLTGAENKIWHAHPVWFLDGNPIVGYSKLKDGVRLLFWSGESFEEEGLKKVGEFQIRRRTLHFGGRN